MFLGFPEVKTLISSNLEKRLNEVQEMINKYHLIENYLYKPSLIPNIGLKMDNVGKLQYFAMNVTQPIGIEVPFNRSYLLDFDYNDLKIYILNSEEIKNTEQDAINIIFKSLCQTIKQEIIYMPECSHKVNLIATLNNFHDKENIALNDFDKLQNSVSSLINFMYPDLRNSYRNNKYCQLLFDNRISELGQTLSANVLEDMKTESLYSREKKNG
jgi:hypothetical protein